MILLELLVAFLVSVVLSAIFALATWKRGKRKGLIWLFLILSFLLPRDAMQRLEISYTRFKKLEEEQKVSKVTFRGAGITLASSKPL